MTAMPAGSRSSQTFPLRLHKAALLILVLFAAAYVRPWTLGRLRPAQPSPGVPPPAPPAVPPAGAHPDAPQLPAEADQQTPEPGPEVVESLKEWMRAGAGHPHLAYRTRKSRCMVLPDGAVQAPGAEEAGGGAGAPAPTRGLPFLFDASRWPDQTVACRHCDAVKTGVHCCGVCMFEGTKSCAKSYPGQNKSAAAAELLMQAGLDLQAFTPCELFQRIRGRTLWFMGDSHTWGMFYAAECFLREFARTLIRRRGLPDAAHNLRLKLLPHVSAPLCLHMVHGTRVCGVRVDFASDLQHKILPRLMQAVPGFANDILVFNTGVHYDPFAPAPEPIRDRYYRELAALADFKQANSRLLPKVVWMDTGPQHFSTHGGLFPGLDKQPYKCQPLEAWYGGDPEILAGTWRNIAVLPLVPRLADAHLRVYNASVPLWESHLPKECSHWCHAAAYELWVYLLNDVLRDSGLGSPVRVLQSTAAAAPAQAAAATPAAAGTAVHEPG